MKDKWIEDLREGMSRFEMEAPDGLWESLGIERRLWRRKLLRRIATAAAALLLLIGASWIAIVLTDQKDLELPGPDMAQIGHDIDPPIERNLSEQRYGNIVDNAPARPRRGKATFHNQSTAADSIIAENSYTGAHVTDEIKDTETPEDSLDNKESSTHAIVEITKNQKNTHKSIYTDSHLRQKRKGRRRNSNRLSLSAVTSGIGGTSADITRMSSGGNWSSSTQDPTTPPLPPEDPDTSLGNPILDPDDDKETGNKDSDGASKSRAYDFPNTRGERETDGKEDITHHQPIRFGLTLQYNVSKRIGIETGLMYTLLTSDIVSRSGNRTASGTRHLHYIGIPVNLKFSAWSWKWIDVYLSAGVLGEKCVSNNFRDTPMSVTESFESFSQKKERPFQWSVNAGLGVQIKPLPNIGIFAEPGVSYWFDDGSSLSTIYKERPCSFNLNLGIRWMLNP